MTIRLLPNIYTRCPVNWDFAASLCLGQPKHRLYHDYTFRRPWDGAVTTRIPRSNRRNRCFVTGGLFRRENEYGGCEDEYAHADAVWRG